MSMGEKAKATMTDKLRAYIRSFRGYCPRCNSDAPEIDICRACENWRGPFPPPNWLAATWLIRHLEPKEWSSK